MTGSEMGITDQEADQSCIMPGVEQETGPADRAATHWREDEETESRKKPIQGKTMGFVTYSMAENSCPENICEIARPKESITLETVER